MSSLADEILSVAQAAPEGHLLNARQFLHFGSRAAVDQALVRLCRQGQLLRVSRGFYAVPVRSRFGVRPPSAEAIVSALAQQCGEQIVPSGAAEANALGLTTQVPVSEVFLTSGSARRLTLGNRQVELRPGTHWQLALGCRPAGRAVRALDWLGPDAAPKVLEQLHQELPSAEWDALWAARSMLPTWMARVIGLAGPVALHA